MRPQPGLAFTMATDVGFLVGLMTHKTPKVGALIWVATPTFERVPSVHDVEAIESWRWPIYYPLGSALRAQAVTPIGIVPIPPALKPFPTLRGGHKQLGWTAFTERDGRRLDFGPTKDATLPIYTIVNDARLREMVIGGWRPEHDF